MRILYVKIVSVLMVSVSIALLIMYWSYKMQFNDPDIITLSKNEKEEDIYNEAKYFDKNNLACDSMYDTFTKDLFINIKFQYPVLCFNGLFSLEDEIKDDVGYVRRRQIFFSDELIRKIRIRNICYSQNQNLKYCFVFRFVEKSGTSYSWYYSYNPFQLKPNASLDLLLTYNKYSGKNKVEELIFP